MDHTMIATRIEELENSDAAEAVDLADEVVAELAHLLDPGKETSD